jgi:hypothetical protein
MAMTSMLLGMAIGLGIAAVKILTETIRVRRQRRHRRQNPCRGPGVR